MTTTSLTRKQLIEHLNEDLAREYQAIIAYVIYSQVLKGARVHGDRERARGARRRGTGARAHDRQARSTTSAARPRPTSKPVKVSDEPKAMLRFDLENENETIRNYRERVQQCEALCEYRDRRRHPRDPAPGTGTPDRPRHGARRGRPRCLEEVDRAKRLHRAWRSEGPGTAADYRHAPGRGPSTSLDCRRRPGGRGRPRSPAAEARRSCAIFPVIGTSAIWLESIGPELRQYIVTGNHEERPFSRDQRALGLRVVEAARTTTSASAPTTSSSRRRTT